MAQSADRDANRALRARLDDVHGQYTRLRAGLDEMQARLSQMSVSVTSADRLVTATVGPRGHLVRLELDSRIYRDADPEALAAKITAAVQAATAKAADDVAAVMSEYLPAGSGSLEYLRSNDVGALLGRFDAALSGQRDEAP